MNIEDCTLEFRAQRAPWHPEREIHIFVIGRHLSGQERKVGFGLPLVLEQQVSAMGVERRPCFSLTPEEAQKLMDELWRAGIRPVEGAGSAGQLSATQAHLDDMRTIAFKVIETKKAK